jgi:DNA (cytosine-5)-methyltransferase 1
VNHILKIERDMLNGLDLFTGIGGIALGLKGIVAPVAYCECDEFCQSVLLQSMRRGLLPKAFIWDDVRTLDCNGMGVDIVTAGFPCQDISIAGHRKGLDGERSGLFFEILRIVDEIGHVPFIFLENVPAIRSNGAERVSKELAKRGYDMRWATNSAAEFGAPHKRERWWLLAYSPGKRLSTRTGEDLQSKGEKPIIKIFSDLCGETSKNPWEAEPPFVEWLMGYPTGWTELKHWEIQ